MAQREVIYPPAFRELLDRLGIDSNKEAEAVADGPLANGLHHYGGWFFFVGEMISARGMPVTDGPHFEFSITRGGPCPKAFRELPHLAVEFEAQLRWALPEYWDSDSRPAKRTLP